MRMKFLKPLIFLLLILFTISQVLGYNYLSLTNLQDDFLRQWTNSTGTCPVQYVNQTTNGILFYQIADSSCSGSTFTYPIPFITTKPIQLLFYTERIQETNGAEFKIGLYGTCEAYLKFKADNQPPLYHWREFYVIGVQQTYSAVLNLPGWVKNQINIWPNATSNLSRKYVEYYEDNVLKSNTTFSYCTDSNLYLTIKQQGTNVNPSIQQTKIDNMSISGYANNSICPGHQAPPIVVEDNFDYFNFIDSCGWYPEPIHNIVPTMGQLCFSGTTMPQDFRYYLPIQGNFFGANVFTEEFDLTLDNNSGFEKDFKFLGDKEAYVFDWFSIGNDTYIQYTEMINGTSSFSSLCSNCWNQNIKDHYKIMLYGGRGGETVFNLSQNSFQNVNTDTVSLQVNNDQIYFNIPMIQMSDYRIPEDMDLFIANGQFCLDNYILYSGKISYAQEIPNITGIPTKDIGEHCNTDWECYSGLCNYLHICDLKGYLAVCLNDIECMSKNCNDGYCTKPTFWESVVASKSDLVGDDEKTNNLLSLFISLGIGTALTIGGAIAGAGIVSGALGMAAFTMGCFFFTVVGWLSPFILIGVIIVVVLLIILIVTLR